MRGTVFTVYFGTRCTKGHSTVHELIFCNSTGTPVQCGTLHILLQFVREYSTHYWVQYTAGTCNNLCIVGVVQHRVQYRQHNKTVF